MDDEKSINLGSVYESVVASELLAYHSALNASVQNEDYHIKKAFVLSNERTVKHKGKITYLPVYYIMFFRNTPDTEDMKF